MADAKISQLTGATTPLDGTEITIIGWTGVTASSLINQTI